MEFTFSFLHSLAWGIYLTLPPLVFFCAVIIVLGLIAGNLEQWTPFDSIYWAFVTALTVGYGDFKPSRKITKVLSLIIAVIGFMLFGIIVAITVNTFSVAFNEFVQLPVKNHR